MNKRNTPSPGCKCVFPASTEQAGEQQELIAVLRAIQDCKNDTKCTVCSSIIRHALARATEEVKKR